MPTVMRINQSQIFNKTLIVLFLARIHLKYLGLFSETFLRTSMRPSLSGSPATPRASSGSPTCPSGLGQTSRCLLFLAHFFLHIFFSQVIATCICLSLSAYVTLALHFLPKLYIILFQPHKNDRSFFTTASKNVRMLIFISFCGEREGHYSQLV